MTYFYWIFRNVCEHDQALLFDLQAKKRHIVSYYNTETAKRLWFVAPDNS